MRRVVIAVVLAAAGCKNTLHWAAIEDDIQARLKAHDVVADAVTCPETEVVAHLRFDCQASFRDGSALTVHVELLDQIGSYQMNTD